MNSRFSSGFTTSPVMNTSPLFIGADYDWSGVSWLAGSGVTGRVHNQTMFTPLHAFAAKHATYNLPTEPGGFLLMNSAGELISQTFSSVNRQLVINGSTGHDVATITFTEALTEEQSVAAYRFLDVSNFNIVGSSVLLYGSKADSTGPRIGTGTISSVSDNHITWSAGTAAIWEGGDSSSPMFIPYTAPDGTKELTLAGSAWYPTIAGNALPRASSNPVTPINNSIKETGYAMKWTIYDNPSDAQDTAARWTGGSGNGNLSAGGNWSNGVSPHLKPVVFNSATAGGQTTLSPGPTNALRGMVFRDNGAGQGFVFNGSNILYVGYSGIRNESTETQTFQLPVTVYGSQNWEAVNGDLVFNGAIGTAGHLVVVGGDQDTVITGVISGSGSLAKDDGGTLTLGAANSYTGGTILHNGTLHLEAGATLGGGAIQFIAGNDARLEINGNSFTVAGLSSSYGGTGKVLLGGGALTVDAASTQTYAGSIVGTGTLTKSGAGTWILTGSNAYAAQTRIEDGVLRVAGPNSLSANTKVVLGGGILELGAGDFTGSLGSGAGQVRFLAGTDGGFSAHGADRIVNLGGTGGTVTWNTGGFVSNGNALLLSSNTATATLEFQNGINLNAGTRLIRTDNGKGAIDARITGGISNGSLSKGGGGVLELSGANTYSGATTINSGALLVSAPNALGSGNLNFNGGILMLGASDLTRGLGSGAGQVRFTNNGGFAAYGSDRSVTLGSASTVLTWGVTSGFLADGKILMLADTASNATVDLVNAINFNATAQTVQVKDGLASADARLSGNLSNGTLIKTGDGVLELTGSNTISSLMLNAGVVRAGSAGAAGTGNLNLNGGILELAAGNFTRSLGTGAGQVQWGDSGGFGAVGATRTVNVGGSGATLTWGVGGFVAAGNSLVLSSESSNATVNMVNGLNFNGGARTVQVNDGTAAVDARLSGSLSNGSLIKSGEGTLDLTGANSYTGATTITDGALRVTGTFSLPGSSNLVLDGGVLELANGDFTRSLGPVGGQLQFAGSGGFSASGGTRTVNLGGAGATLTWGSGSFLADDASLILSSNSSNSTVVLANPIQLNAAGNSVRIIDVRDGSAAIDARMTGSVTSSDPFEGFYKTGTGTLEITGSFNPRARTTVSAGTLIVSGAFTSHSTPVHILSDATFDYRGGTVLGRDVLIDGGKWAYNSAASYGKELTFISGVISGTGNLKNTAITLGAGQAIAPGNSAGTLATGTQTWEEGGAYLWEIASLTGTAGTAWDSLSITGNLNILAGSEEFTLRLDSLGALAGWDSSQDYSWQIASTSAGIVGFDAASFQIDVSAFANENALDGGYFGLTANANSLSLTFTAGLPVPEPEVAVLLGIGFLFLMTTRSHWRNRRHEKGAQPGFF